MHFLTIGSLFYLFGAIIAIRCGPAITYLHELSTLITLVVWLFLVASMDDEDCPLWQMVVVDFLVWYQIAAFGNRVWTHFPKRLAWWITGVNAGLLSLLSAAWIATHGLSFAPEDVFASTSWSQHICVFFAVANFMDMANGRVWYPRDQSWLLTWIHHPFFIVVMILALTGWGHPAPYPNLFMIMMIEELPTYVLAQGCIVPGLRSDWGFGVSFFVLRILFHAYVLFELVRLETVTLLSPIACIFALACLLHVKWFSDWARKYAVGKPHKN